jgi:hypothetical protein
MKAMQRVLNKMPKKTHLKAKNVRVNMNMIKETMDYLNEANELRDKVWDVLGTLLTLKNDAEKSAQSFSLATDSAMEFKEKIENLGLTFDASLIGSDDEKIQELINNGYSARDEMYQIAGLISEIERTIS